jgi:hypothetical protein
LFETIPQRTVLDLLELESFKVLALGQAKGVEVPTGVAALDGISLLVTLRLGEGHGDDDDAPYNGRTEGHL